MYREGGASSQEKTDDCMHGWMDTYLDLQVAVRVGQQEVLGLLRCRVVLSKVCDGELIRPFQQFTHKLLFFLYAFAARSVCSSVVYFTLG